MKKLYCLDFEYEIEALEKHGLLGRLDKPVTVKRWSDDIFIVCDTNNMQEEVEKWIRKKHKKDEEKIESSGSASIYNLESCLFNCRDIEITKIINYKVTKISYTEAKLMDCIKYLTPEQFSELYGHLDMFQMKGK